MPPEPKAKPSLTAEQAENARRMRQDGVGVAQIAKTYNVSRQTIYTLLKSSQSQESQCVRTGSHHWNALL